MNKLFHILLVTATLHISSGQDCCSISPSKDCCPEQSWEVLLRKDGEPEYKDKGVVEKASGNSDDDQVLTVKKVRVMFGKLLTQVMLADDEEKKNLVEEELVDEGGEDMEIYRVGSGNRVAIQWVCLPRKSAPIAGKSDQKLP